MKKAIILLVLAVMILTSSCTESKIIDFNDMDIYEYPYNMLYMEEDDYCYYLEEINDTQSNLIKKDKNTQLTEIMVTINATSVSKIIDDNIYYFDKQSSDINSIEKIDIESGKSQTLKLSDARTDKEIAEDEYSEIISEKATVYVGEDDFCLVYFKDGKYIVYNADEDFKIRKRICVMDNMRPAILSEDKIFAIKENEFYIYDIEKKETKKLCKTEGYDIRGYVGNGMFALYCIRGENNGIKTSILDIDTLKETYIDAETNSEPAYNDKNIYMCTVNKGVLKIPKDTLVPETIYEYNGKQTDSPILSGDTLYFAEINKEQNPAYEIKSVKIK